MRTLLMTIAVVTLFAVPAMALDPVEDSADITLTIERYLSLEITTPPDIVIEGGASEGQAYVGFTVRYNFIPCYYEYWCEIAAEMPEHWDLVNANPCADGCMHGDHPCSHNTYDDFNLMNMFPDGYPAGSSGAKLTGVKLSDNADLYTDAVIGTIYFQFMDGTSPCGD